MRIVSYPEAEVPIELRAQVVALQDQAWPNAGPSNAGPSGTAPWHDPALHPRSVLLLDGDRVVTALDILSKEFTHRGERWAASGLSTVVTGAELRGRGYGSELVEAARRLIAASDIDLGIFTCDRALQAFYERAGWRHLPGTVIVGGTPDAPFPSDRFDKVTMASFFSPRARAASADFEACRIELYPGTIDTLW
jgi:aminoglycoside 2'-N-acetyltransferase I